MTTDAASGDGTPDILAGPARTAGRKLPSVARGCAPALGGQLRGEGGDELRVVAEVAPPEAAWLLSQAIGPFESRLLDPARGLRNQSGVKIERRADPDEHRRAQLRPHAGHPLLLLGHAYSRPHDISPRVVDLLDHGGLLFRGEGTVRRGVTADDPHAGETPAEIEGKLHQRALIASAVEVEAVPVV